MRENAVTACDNRPKLPICESMANRRQDSRPTKTSPRPKLVFKEYSHLAESNSAVQSKLVTVSSGNPYARSFPQKIDRTKNISAVDTLRCTQIPGPNKQGRPPRFFVAKTAADGKSQNEANHLTILHNKRTKSVKAKSLSLIGNVTADCRIPDPAKNRASFGQKSIGEVNASQPKGKATCKSVPLLKENLDACQRKQGKSPSSRTPVVTVNKASRISAVQKAPRLPNAISDGVCQSRVSASSSNLSIINSPQENNNQAFASGKDAENSSSYTVLQSSYQRQSSQERVLENPDKDPSIDFLLQNRASGVSPITTGLPSRSIVLEGNSLGDSSTSGQRLSGQNNTAKAVPLAESMTGSALTEPCIEIMCWTRGNRAEHSHLSRYNEIEIIPQGTNTAAPTSPTLRDANSVNHDDSHTTDWHRKQESCTTCTSDCFPPKDDGNNPNPSGVLMAPNWNILKLDLDSDSPLESPVRPLMSSVIHKTSGDGAKDGVGKKSHLSAKQTSAAATKISPGHKDFAAPNENSETRSSTNTAKKKLLLTRANSSASSVQSTFSGLIKKRGSNSRAISVGIHDRNKDASISSVQAKGQSKKCPQVKKEGLLKVGISSVIKASPLCCSNLSSTPDQLSQVEKKELTQESLQKKMKSCQELDANIKKLPDQLISDQLTSQNPAYHQRRDSKTTVPQKQLKCLQPKDGNTSVLLWKGREEEKEVKILPPEIQNRDVKDFSTIASADQPHEETKMSKSTDSYKETNAKTFMSESQGRKDTNLTNSCLNRQNSTKLLSLKQCHEQSDTQKMTPEFLCHTEAYSRKVTHGNKNNGETDFKTVKFEDKSLKGTDSQTVTFENQFHKKTETQTVLSISGNQFHRETKSRIEAIKDQHQEEKSDQQDSLPEVQNRKETLSEPVTSENLVEQDLEIVVLKSQALQKNRPQKETSKRNDEKKVSHPGNYLKLREEKSVRRTNPTQNVNLAHLLAVTHGDDSGRQLVQTTGKLAGHGVCPFKGQSKLAGSGVKNFSTTSQVTRTAKAPTQTTEPSIKELKQGLGFRAKLDCMEEELESLAKEFKALDEGEALLPSSSDYDSDTSLLSSSSSSSSPASPASSSAATSSSDFVRSESRMPNVVRDDGSHRRWSTAKFYKFLPVLSPKQKLLPRIPQNKRDPSEWLRSQAALESYREATRPQPKRTTSETSYLSPCSRVADDLLDSFVRATDVAAATPNRYPKISDARFNEATNQELCAVSAADCPNFWVTLFVEMPSRTNTTVYNIKIELACCALRAFFDPCDRIKFAYVRSVREKLTELIQDGLARPKFDEFVCCERYDCVLMLSLDAGALLRHPKTSFVYSLSSVLEVEPNRVLVLVSTYS